jgi:hypothetical protein
MTRRALSLRCAARRRSPHLDSMQRIATHFAEPRRNDPAFIETFFSSRRYATRLDLVPRFVMLPGSTPGAQVYRFATQFHLSQRHFTTRTATQRPAFIERSSRRAVTPYLSTQRNVAPRYDSQHDDTPRLAPQFDVSTRSVFQCLATQRPAFIQTFLLPLRSAPQCNASDRLAPNHYAAQHYSTDRSAPRRYPARRCEPRRDLTNRNATTSIHTFSTRRITPHDVPNRFAPRRCAAQLDAAQFLAPPRCVTFRNSPRRSKSL